MTYIFANPVEGDFYVRHNLVDQNGEVNQAGQAMDLAYDMVFDQYISQLWNLPVLDEDEFVEDVIKLNAREETLIHLANFLDHVVSEKNAFHAFEGQIKTMAFLIRCVVDGSKNIVWKC